MGVRRVVTGHDENGKAIVVADGDATNVVRQELRPGVVINNLWRLDGAPAKVFGPEETIGETVGLLPPKNGSVFRVIEFPPEKDWLEQQVDTDTTKAYWASMGAEQVGDSREARPHPMMHRTETVDFALCLEGEIHLLLDDSEVLIKAGDAVIQRGTNHAWNNRTDRVCKMMFVLIDGTFEG